MEEIRVQYFFPLLLMVEWSREQHCLRYFLLSLPRVGSLCGCGCASRRKGYVEYIMSCQHQLSLCLKDTQNHNIGAMNVHA